MFEAITKQEAIKILKARGIKPQSGDRFFAYDRINHEIVSFETKAGRDRFVKYGWDAI